MVQGPLLLRSTRGCSWRPRSALSPRTRELPDLSGPRGIPAIRGPNLPEVGDAACGRVLHRARDTACDTHRFARTKHRVTAARAFLCLDESDRRRLPARGTFCLLASRSFVWRGGLPPRREVRRALRWCLEIGRAS